MKLIKHAEGVYEIERFLDEELRSTLVSEAQLDIDWDTTHIGSTVKDMSYESRLKMNNVYKTIETLFINIESIIYSRELRRLRNSEFMWPHEDGGNPDDPRKIVFGIAIYLNDTFTGGELIYPDLGLSVTPRPGSMVIHSAHLKHQVFPVLGGERYSITTFVFGNKSTKFAQSAVVA
jgi:hypothetical protein